MSKSGNGFCGNLSKLLLVLINLVFLTAGCLLVYFSVYVKDSGWLNVFDQEYSYFKSSSFYALLGFGILVILISLLGFIGALGQNRCLLCTYAIFLVLSIIIFLLLAIVGFGAMAVAKDWQDKTYPAEKEEETVAQSFNEVYCYAEGLRLCLKSTPLVALTLLKPSLASILQPFLKDTPTVAQLCKKDLSTVAKTALKDVCAACEKADKWKSYASVADWVEEKCPATAVTAAYCFEMLQKQDDTTSPPLVSIIGTPYASCRTSMLEMWAKWSTTFSVCCAILMAAAIVILVFTCILRKRSAARTPRSNYAAA